ncbi:MAG: ABC-type lipoprotein release transport system permease subunit [Myxococcota bacterium]|jgi:ABC-type lipoprotein release transport system permease subunit
MRVPFSLIVSLALRNLTRNVRRTFITSAAVIAGVAVLIVGYGLMDGLDENVIRAQEDAVAGHVILRPAGYPDDGISHPVDAAVPIGAELTAALTDDSRVVAWASRLWFQARIIHGADAVRIKGIAYDPDAEDTVFPRDEWELDGRWPEDTSEVALGSGLARMLGVELGANVVLEARTKPGALNALPFTVSGIVSAHSPSVDALSVWMPLATAEELVLPGGTRSHIAVRVRRRGLAAPAAAALSVGGWEAHTAIEEVAGLLALNAFRRQAVSLVVFILMAIAATGIANTVIMAAYERVREVGTLRAMGMSQSAVRALFLVEGAVLGLFAGLLGAAVGAAVVAWFSANGIDIGWVVNNLGEVSMSTVLYMHFSWQPVLFSVAFGLGISLLASLWPAQHAASLNPADAVRAD